MDSDKIIYDDNDDYEFTRETLRDLVDKGATAFEDMINVAKESEHPRAYEVLSGMMKNIADISEKLIDINKKRKETHFIGRNPRKEALPDGTTTNNIFVGSTSELQKMLNKHKEENVIDVTPVPHEDNVSIIDFDIEDSSK